MKLVRTILICKKNAFKMCALLITISMMNIFLMKFLIELVLNDINMFYIETHPYGTSNACANNIHKNSHILLYYFCFS